MILIAEQLDLILQTREEVERMIESMSDYDRAQVSPDWLLRMRASNRADPWLYGFRIVHRDSGELVGNCGFKGPPVDGVVEIAYGIDPAHEGKGYATEAARALIEYATSCNDVTTVRAHTLPNAAGSQRVLAKCGFHRVGEVTDPEDGTVSRYEKAVGAGRA